ncbi:MAG: hypothetical protein KDA25_10120 [Phycisphaerales bacterium]|nr:hypothetical protein [Phycisphaerales bacterium]
MTESGITVSSLPAGEIIPAALFLLIGLILIVAGARVLRAAVAAVGLVVGTVIGLSLGAALDLGVPAWAPAITGGIVLAVIAAIVYRLAIMSTLVAMLAIALPMGVWTVASRGWVNFGPMGPLPAAVPEADLDRVRDATAGLPPELAEALGPILNGSPSFGSSEVVSEEIGRRVGAGLNTVSDQMGLSESSKTRLMGIGDGTVALVRSGLEHWHVSPPKLRLSLLAAALLGALSGLLLATTTRAFSARFVTAAFGAAIVLGSAWLLAARLDVLPPADAAAPILRWWPLGWLALATIGMAIQLRFRPAPTDKTA